jgi:hypothetical protein
MVQIFFAWRVHVLVKRWWLTAFICVLAVVVARMDLTITLVLILTRSTVGGVGSGVAATNLPVVDFIKYFWIVTPWLVCSAVCDITITVALTWKLVS